MTLAAQLGALDCRVEKVLKKGKVYLVRRHRERLLCKVTDAPGLRLLREQLPSVAAACSEFVIPAFIAGGPLADGACWVLTSWLEGEPLGRHWHEWRPGRGGGKGLDPALIPVLLRTLLALRSLPAAPLAALADRRWTRARLAADARKLVSGRAELAAAVAPLLAEFADSATAGAALSNEDFQWRNLILMADGRLGLVDWDGARVSDFETTHCVAYQWLLMWGDPGWRAQYLRRAQAELALERSTFRALLIVDGLRLALRTWPRRAWLQRLQLKQLASALDDDAFKRIWEP